MSNIKRRIVVVTGLLILSSLAFSRTSPTPGAAAQVGAFPKGVIIAWNAKSGAVPAGWAICDGTNGTPDLRRRFLMGVATLADVGQTAGSAAHRHSVIGGTSTARSKPDGWGLGANANRSSSPSVTGLDHSHSFTAVSTEESNIPPSYTVIFLMKL
jgi:hypothetical protein